MILCVVAAYAVPASSAVEIVANAGSVTVDTAADVADVADVANVANAVDAYDKRPGNHPRPFPVKQNRLWI